MTNKEINEIITTALENAYSKIMAESPSGDTTPEQHHVLEVAKGQIVATMTEVYNQN